MSVWNKGHLTGRKPPLKPREVRSIRLRLQVSGDARELALFNLAIDSKLRGCNLVAIKVGDVAVSGTVRDRAVMCKRKQAGNKSGCVARCNCNSGGAGRS